MQCCGRDGTREGGIAKVESGGGDEEVTGDEGVESGDMLGEETGEDGSGESTRGGEAEGVERIGTGATGVIGESGKVRKEISST